MGVAGVVACDVDLALVAAGEADRLVALGAVISAKAIQIDGGWYVVTTGAGDVTFAYAIVSASGLNLDSGWIWERWDYSTWRKTSLVSTCADRRVAIAYYILEGGLLNVRNGGRIVGGTYTSVLSTRDVEIIDETRAILGLPTRAGR
jgi:hypothetical protein